MIDPSAPPGRCLLAGLALTLLGSGCGLLGTRDSDPNNEYPSAEQRELLEVPPNLAAADDTGRLFIPRDGEGKISRSMLLPQPDNVRLVRHGSSRWLEITTERPEELWPVLSEFWAAEGYPLVRSEPVLGIMETSWQQIADAPSSTGGASVVLQRFRTRLERLPDGSGVRVFVSHRSFEEVAAAGDDVYQRTTPDESEETEALARLLIFMGVREQYARGILTRDDVNQLGARAYLERSTNNILSVVVTDSFFNVWPKTGDALESIGLEIEQTLPSAARYDVVFNGDMPDNIEVREQDEAGFLSKFFGNDGVEQFYQISLREEPGGTRISIADATGVSAYPELEDALMRQLYEELQ